MSDAQTKNWLQRLADVPGRWRMYGNCIRHSHIRDNAGQEACPLVALVWHEKRRRLSNEGVHAAWKSTGLDRQARGAVISAADGRFIQPELRRSLLDVCDLVERDLYDI